jgi:ATF/CREB family transcription factor
VPNGKPRRSDSISVEEDEEEEEEDDAAGSPPESSTTQVNGKKGGQKKPETEEEKRKNFLERNRQGMFTNLISALYIVVLTHLTSAALKCRQRKKAWLAQLQAKNEYLTQENQRLQEALVSTREELARLTAGAPLIPVGVAANAPPNAHPVSVNVSLPASASAKAVARGYGY